MNTMLILNKDGKLKNMENTTKFKVAALIGIILLIATIGVSASLTAQYTIHNSGTIALETRPLTSSFAFASQLRYTYFGSESMLIQDWATVAATIKAYDMGPVIQKCLYTWKGPTDLITERGGLDFFRMAIDALHAQGIKFHVSYAVLFSDFPTMISRGMIDPSVRQIDADGNSVAYWGDPCNPYLQAYINSIVDDLVQNYEIDGISFDYVRYDATNVPYGPYCKAEFEAYLGETISDSDFHAGGAFGPGGARYNEFMQWRLNPITEVIGLIKQWADEARQKYHPELPALEYTATVFADTVSNLWWFGQDAINWVRLGYVDVLLPMLYSQDLTDDTNHFIQAKNLLGGAEGVIPLAPLLSHVAHGPIQTPADWAAEVNSVMSNGADGWSSWCYAGPGFLYPDQPDAQFGGTPFPDIRPYWDLITRSPVFSLSNITVSHTANSATITWKTELPATSKVEYSTSPLFVASKIKAPSADYPYAQLDYWDFDYVPGTTVESSTPVTYHSVTVTGLSLGVVYYFRVQSQDSSGIATSKVYTFRL